MMSIHPMDPRIGQLNGLRYYVYAQGYWFSAAKIE